jgi:hypothetical protein
MDSSHQELFVVPQPEFVMYLKVVPAVQQFARQMHL